MEDPCAFDILFSRNVPHLLEKIFFFLDYESYKTCLEVSIVWKELLTSKSFQMKGKSVFRKEIFNEGLDLFIAAKEGDKDKASEILKTGMVNGDSTDSTALGAAACNGHTEIVQLLIDSGADINKTDIFGKTPLYHAVDNGIFNTDRDEKVVLQMLLGANINPFMTDSDGNTEWAVRVGRKDVVQLLLQRGANPNIGSQRGNTPLHVAAHWDYRNGLQKLIEGGADLNKQNHWGETPLLHAVKRNQKAAVKLLMDNGADQNIANENGATPISVAFMKGFLDIVNILKGQEPPGQQQQQQPQLQPQPQQNQQQQANRCTLQ